VERDSIDRIRSATFPIARRGYEKREVDRFLTRLAEWLETGGADQSRAEILRRDLERVGEQTGKILTEAHDAGERIRADAEREAAETTAAASTAADETRAAADRYASETRAAAEADAVKARGEADEYASETRAEADAYAAACRQGADAYAAKVRAESEAAAAGLRERADADADETLRKARAEAARVVEEGNRRRGDIEAVISDLEARRDGVVADMQRLSTELAGTATEHSAAAASDEPQPSPSAAGREAPAARNNRA
jgi:DivIVA domain-containing protein